MSIDYFILFFLLFAGSAFFLCLLGLAGSCRPVGRRSLFHAPWIGFGLLVGLLQIAHLLSPIDRRFSIVFVACVFLTALTALLIHFSYRSIQRAGIVSGLAWLSLLGGIALIIFLPVFNSCTKEMYRYDLGLYYLKTIRWTQSFPIVAGLANVQDHLGFNQSAFLPTSLFDSLMPDGWGLFLIGGILPWLGITLSLFAIIRLAIASWRHGDRAETIEVAYAVSLPAWIFTFLTGDSSSASPDCVSACLMLHYFLVFACFVLQRDEEPRTNLGEIIFLGVLCLCIKLNSLGLVIGIWSVSGAILWLRKEGSLLSQRRVVVMGVLSIIMLGTWVGRGIVLSGYPFFPSSAMAMPVTWRTPVERVDGFRTLIRGWARDRENVARSLKSWQWLPNWYQRVASELTNRFTWPAQNGLAGLIALSGFALFVNPLRKNFRDLLLLAAPLLIYAIFWFITAPEPRYFGTTVWMLAMCPALTFIAGGSRFGLIASLANLSVSILPISFSAWEFRWSWAQPEPRLPEVHVVETLPVASHHGVLVWVPREGDRTFDSPIPSSQGPVPGLAFLDPSRGIAGGFKYVSVENNDHPQ
jgi:hypothetical protein